MSTFLRQLKLVCLIMRMLVCCLIIGQEAVAANPANKTTCLSKARQLEGFVALQQLGVTVAEYPQRDYVAFHPSSRCYFSAWPETTAEVAALVKVAYTYYIPIRVQGRSHSANGSSLPNTLELLINTALLNQIEFNQPGYITVGAGIPIDRLHRQLFFHHYDTIPVYNSGGEAPSIGGFIAAGGIGEDSKVYGGLWENVQKVTLVTGYGRVLRVNQHDSLFPWLFGSMGQLGIITEAVLKVIPEGHDNSFSYPLGLKTKFLVDKTDGYRWTLSNRKKPYYWFHIFVRNDQINEARKTLVTFQKSHPMCTYFYHDVSVQYLSMNPPLIYPYPHGFSVALLACYLLPIVPLKEYQSIIFSYDRDFTMMAAKKGYHRYIQVDLAYKPDDYRNYFGDKLYQQFKKIKSIQDPKFLFNQGNVFASGHK